MAGWAGFRFRELLRDLRARAIVLPLIAAIAGCQASGDIKHASSGIGDDLYSSDLAAATRDLETYFGFICKQANIPTIPGPDNYPECDYASIDSEGWTVIVQTGFNDIDRRCDGYLEWLEQERHRAVFVNSQINSVGRLTNQVLTAVVPTAGLAIGIVSEAFGFAKSAFNDYQTLIMLGYESSTIKTIVSERRLAFRVQFSNVVFKYKPDAVNVLRSYLRICMPYTITMDANTYARALATGDGLPNYVDSGIERETIVGENALAAKTSESFATGNAEDSRLVEPQKNPNVVLLFGEQSGRTIDSVKFVQNRLCAADDGIVKGQTELAVTNWRRAKASRVVAGDNRLPLSQAETLEITSLPLCDAAVFTNYYERTILADPVQITSFVLAYNKAGGNELSMPDSPTITSDKNSDFRKKIAEMRRFLVERHGLTETVPKEAEHFVTFEMRLKMVVVASGGG